MILLLCGSTLNRMPPGTYLPGLHTTPAGSGQKYKDHLQVITVINFKGGSCKKTTSAHLAQECVLHSYQLEFDLMDGGTLYDAIRYDDPVPHRIEITRTFRCRHHKTNHV